MTRKCVKYTFISIEDTCNTSLYYTILYIILWYRNQITDLKNDFFHSIELFTQIKSENFANCSNKIKVEVNTSILILKPTARGVFLRTNPFHMLLVSSS